MMDQNNSTPDRNYRQGSGSDDLDDYSLVDNSINMAIGNIPPQLEVRFCG